MITKSIFVTCALIMFLLNFYNTSFSQDRGFGLGILLGEPTGMSMKGWVSSSTAIDAGVAWSFHHEGSFHLHADYLFHSFDVFKTQDKIPLYYGIGGRIKTGRNQDTRLGLRMVVGVDYLFQHAPFDIFVELAPILDLTPATEAQVNAGIGGRFWFK